MSEFFAMNGYGFYVWGAYGVAALVVAVEILSVKARRRRALEHARLGSYENVSAVPAPEVAR